MAKPREPALAKAWPTMASNPTPAVQKNGFPLSEQVSMVLALAVFKKPMAFSSLSGMFKSLASPLPEPIGIMPRAVLLFNSPVATSFTVPSPPTAMTLSTPFSTAC